MYCVRVKASTHEGFGELQGMLHFRDGKIRLQYQSGDALLGLWKSSAKEREIPLELLQRVTYRAGFLRLFPRIELYFSDFVAASKLPAAEAGVLRLKLPLGERERAMALVENAETARALLRTLQLEKDIEKLSSADPLSSANGTPLLTGIVSTWVKQKLSSQ